MPKDPSQLLIALGSRLNTIRGKLASGKYLTWSQTGTYCNIHEVEISVIPLGVREGFDVNIDFHKVHEFLVLGWIGKELALLTERPEQSPFFRNAVASIEQMGLTKWRSLDQQVAQTRKGLTSPG